MEIIFIKGKLSWENEFYSGNYGDFWVKDYCIGSFSKNKTKLLKRAIGRTVTLKIIIPELPEGGK